MSLPCSFGNTSGRWGSGKGEGQEKEKGRGRRGIER